MKESHEVSEGAVIVVTNMPEHDNPAYHGLIGRIGKVVEVSKDPVTNQHLEIKNIRLVTYSHEPEPKLSMCKKGRYNSWRLYPKSDSWVPVNSLEEAIKVIGSEVYPPEDFENFTNIFHLERIRWAEIDYPNIIKEITDEDIRLWVRRY